MIELVRGLYNIKPRHRVCTATLGNFDGLHRGHQAVIQSLVNKAKELGLPACVIVFEPHPQEYFLGKKAPARLMRLSEKLRILQDLSINRVFCLRFNKHLAECLAETFVKEILVNYLGVSALIVGDDFRFGKGRQGDFTCLQRWGGKYNFKVYSTPTVLYGEQRIGSSLLREALQQGNFQWAQCLLNRPFTLSGHVGYGDQRGRLLGFPTANILLHRYVIPLKGVFIVRVFGIGKETLTGVANCGIRPTINGSEGLLEIYLFNFNQTIYGCFLQIEFLKKIRDEAKFSSLVALQKQIGKDVAFAKNYFQLIDK